MKIIGLLLGLFIIVITQLLFLVLIPISIILIVLDIIARKIKPFIYTALMIVTVIIQRIFINIRIPDDVDGFYGINTPNILFFLITDIIIVLFLVLTILSLSKSERLQRIFNKIGNIFNKIGNKFNKNVDKVIDYTKNDIKTAFNIDNQVEKQEEKQEEEEKRIKIILETENRLNKKKIN